MDSLSVGHGNLNCNLGGALTTTNIAHDIAAYG